MTNDLKINTIVLNMRSTKLQSKNSESHGIGRALFPKTKRQLLTLFFLSPGKKYYFREITRLVQVSPGAVQRELKTLVGAGILATEKAGRQRYYWADSDCMIFAELRTIVIKSFGAVETIRTDLEKLRGEIHIAFLYGSLVDGSDTAKSDIDLMVIGDLSYRSLVSNLKKSQDILNRPINPTLYSRKEFLEKIRKGNHFLQAIMKTDRLFIIGSDDDLSRMAG